MKKIYHADMFIIPNSIRTEKCKREYENYFWNDVDKKLRHYFGDEVADLGKGERRLVQVWIVSKESKNWADSGCPIDNGYFPGNFPDWMLEDVKEGDSIDLPLRTGDVLVLTARQLNYRYSRFGSFEDVFKDLTRQR